MKRILKRVLGLTAAVVLAAAGMPGPAASAGTNGAAGRAQEKIVAGYYANWSSYRGYMPGDIQAELLTHLNYAFAKIDPATGRIAMENPENDRKNFEQLRQLKKEHPGLKTLISVGGWDYSAHFSTVAATEEGRKIFAKSCADFLVEHGFDGIDLDWEYPVSGGPVGNAGSPADRENFTLLLSEIRRKLDAQGAADGKRYELSIAGAANANYLKKIEPLKVASLVDHIFVMAYDMHGSWDSYADFGAPLYQPAEPSPQYKNSVADGVEAYLAAGVSADKLVMGIPFYGYLYEGVSGQGLYSTFSSARSISYDQVASQYLKRAGMKAMYHERAAVPWMYGNGVFLSYENAESVAAKAAYAAARNLGGIGIWELSQNRSGELLRSARGAFSTE